MNCSLRADPAERDLPGDPQSPWSRFQKGPEEQTACAHTKSRKLDARVWNVSYKKCPQTWAVPQDHPAWINAGARTGDLLSYPISLSHSPASLFISLFYFSHYYNVGTKRVHSHTECGAGQ